MKECLVLFLIIIIASGQNISKLYKKHRNFKYLDPTQNQCGFSMTDRIIGGEKALMGQYPWMATLGYTYVSDGEVPDVYECGGTIISDLHILTAAHCSPDFKPYKWIEVRLGEYDTRKEKDCDRTGFCLPPPQDIMISSYYCHANYEKYYQQDDICIIRLAQPIKFGAYIQPICLPFYDEVEKDELDDGVPLEVAGWGVHKIDSTESSPILLRLVIPVIEHEICSEILDNIDLTTNQICAGGVKGSDSCKGDSGGPLMKPYSIKGPPKYFLIGIVSFGSTQCGGDVPGVYTDVRHYLKWILDHLLLDNKQQ